MGNTLQTDLTNKVVIFKQDIFKEGVVATEWPFLVSGGFGASAFTRGTALMGEFLPDGERCRMEGWDVDRLATDEEIQAARKRREQEKA
jgi:hypothetical protein